MYNVSVTDQQGLLAGGGLQLSLLPLLLQPIGRWASLSPPFHPASELRASASRPRKNMAVDQACHLLGIALSAQGYLIHNLELQF